MVKFKYYKLTNYQNFDLNSQLIIQLDPIYFKQKKSIFFKIVHL
jgi:hypothetical protein